eukprot:999161-Pelagomonas_calceolata.AAC.5
MVVRGAPAIGVAGALALATDLVANKASGAAFGSVAETEAYIKDALAYLVTSRPTAVNLMDGANKIAAATSAAAGAPGATPASVVEAVVKAAEAYFEEDLCSNKRLQEAVYPRVFLLHLCAMLHLNFGSGVVPKPHEEGTINSIDTAIGAHGASALVAEVQARGRASKSYDKLCVLTHCNTGSLATSGYGTALGVIRSLHEQVGAGYPWEKAPASSICPITLALRTPVSQPHGLPCPFPPLKRLWTWQVMPPFMRPHSVFTLLETSPACHTYASHQLTTVLAESPHATRVDAVVVGADRVVATGDTANKIGTSECSGSCVVAGNTGLAVRYSRERRQGVQGQLFVAAGSAGVQGHLFVVPAMIMTYPVVQE